MLTQWEFFFESTSYRRRISNFSHLKIHISNYFTFVSTAQSDGETNSSCDFDTKLHFAVKSLLIFRISKLYRLRFAVEIRLRIDFANRRRSDVEMRLRFAFTNRLRSAVEMRLRFAFTIRRRSDFEMRLRFAFSIFS